MDFSPWLESLQNINLSSGNGIVILAVGIIIGLVLLYVIFASVRTFFAWLYRIDTVIRTQHDTNNILLEILDTLETMNAHLENTSSHVEKNTKQMKKIYKKEKEIAVHEKIQTYTKKSPQQKAEEIETKDEEI